MTKHKHYHRVLSVYPVARGYAFALFDSPSKLLDWGNRDIGKDMTGAKTVDSVVELLRRNRPDVVVLDDADERSSARALRLKRVQRALKRPIADIGAETAVISRRNVKVAFAQFGALTKQDIAQVVGSRLEALSTRMPRPRKPWMGEDHRMGLFDAASRALTYYQQEGQLDNAHNGKIV